MAYGPYDAPLVVNNVAPAATVTWQGGRGVLHACGTFTTTKIQFLGPDGVTFIDAPLATLSAPGAIGFELHRCQIKAVSTGNAAGFYASASSVPTTSS